MFLKRSNLQQENKPFKMLYSPAAHSVPKFSINSPKIAVFRLSRFISNVDTSWTLHSLNEAGSLLILNIVILPTKLKRRVVATDLHPNGKQFKL